MTTYTTDARLILRTGEHIMQQWAGDANGLIDAAKLAQARTFGFNLINSKLQRLYAQYLPFVGEAIPVVLMDLEDDFSIYWLATTNQQAGEMYIFSYKQALARLDDIANGKEVLISNGLNLTDPIVQSVPGLACSTTLGQPPIFSRKTLFPLMQR